MKFNIYDFLMVIGLLRVILKPIMTFLHYLSDKTKTDKDNKILKKIDILIYLLDWLGSFKIKR